ncbi:MAG: hypothetical protein IT381_23680 [Deltaproteobacteria bacterium]|nr:hypothetical protein [Deltaproteobacteria bacterium]
MVVHAALVASEVDSIAVNVIATEGLDCDELRARPPSAGRVDLDVRYYRLMDVDETLALTDLPVLASAVIVIEALGVAPMGDVLGVGCSDVVRLRAGVNAPIPVTVRR